MAQKVSITLVDDMDGKEAAETVVFGLDGTQYEIDLSARNAAALRKALSGYVGHARKTGGRRVRGTAANGSAGTKRGGTRKRTASMEDIEAAKVKA